MDTDTGRYFASKAEYFARCGVLVTEPRHSPQNPEHSVVSLGCISSSRLVIKLVSFFVRPALVSRAVYWTGASRG